MADESMPSENTLKPTVEQAVEFIKTVVQEIGLGPKKLQEIYANNARFESSVWDLRIVLGNLEQPPGKGVTINFHTSVTIPWAQAKLAAYYLLLNCAWQEITTAPITIPKRVMPKIEPPDGELTEDPNAIAMFEASKKIYQAVFGVPYE